MGYTVESTSTTNDCERYKLRYLVKELILRDKDCEQVHRYWPKFFRNELKKDMWFSVRWISQDSAGGKRNDTDSNGFVDNGIHGKNDDDDDNDNGDDYDDNA